MHKRLERELADTGNQEQKNIILVKLAALDFACYELAINNMRTVREKFRQTFDRWGLNTGKDPLVNTPHKIDDFAQKSHRYLIGALACGCAESILGGIIGMHNGWPFWTGMVIAIIVTLIVDAGLAVFCLHNSNQSPLQAVRLTRFILKIALAFFGVSLILFILGRTVNGSMALTLAPILTLGLFLMPFALIFVGAGCLILASLFRWPQRLTAEWEKAFGQSQLHAGLLTGRVQQLRNNEFNVQSLLAEIYDTCQEKEIGFPIFLKGLMQTGDGHQAQVDHTALETMTPVLNS